MEKDRKIEQKFREYFAGSELPNVDLSAAKAELTARKRAKSRRRKLVAGLVSACACLLVAVTAVMLLNYGPFALPNSSFSEPFVPPSADSPSGAPSGVVYLLSAAERETIGFSDLSKYDPAAASAFAPFSEADNASAEYSLYLTDGTPVLLRADLGLTRGFYGIRATVYVDLTGGAYEEKSLKEYADLGKTARNYRYETTYSNGEYLSKAYCVQNGAAWCFDTISQNEDGLAVIMKILTDL